MAEMTGVPASTWKQSLPVKIKMVKCAANASGA